MRSLAMPAMGTRLGYVPPVTPPGPWCPEAEIRDNLACRICVDGSQERRAWTPSRRSIEDVAQWQDDMLYSGRGGGTTPFSQLPNGATRSSCPSSRLTSRSSATRPTCEAQL